MTDPNTHGLFSRALTTAIVACVFFYFLIFAQFGFIHRLAELNPSGFLNELTLFMMGLGGIAGCIIAARKFRIKHAKQWLMTGFIGCGLAATTVGAIVNMGLAMVAAFAVGIFLGGLTVCVVPIISETIIGHRIGLWTALGVGGAYATANVPLLFNCSAQDHCIIGGTVCALGAILSNFLPALNATKTKKTTETYRTPQCLYAKTGIISVVALFLALIWLDSAAFFIIQETESLKKITWSSDLQLWVIAGIHFAGAILAGWCLDRGWLFQLIIISLAILMIGAWQISQAATQTSSWPVYLYVGAVSIYSVSLVAYGALQPDRKRTPSIQTRAALVFAIAGWFGSGMGIGMAKDLHTVPVFFFVAALAVAAVSIAVSLFGSSHQAAALKKTAAK